MKIDNNSNVPNNSNSNNQDMNATSNFDMNNQNNISSNTDMNAQVGVINNPNMNAQAGVINNPDMNVQAGAVNNPNMNGQPGVVNNPNMNGQSGVESNPHMNSEGDSFNGVNIEGNNKKSSTKLVILIIVAVLIIIIGSTVAFVVAKMPAEVEKRKHTENTSDFYAAIEDFDISYVSAYEKVDTEIDSDAGIEDQLKKYNDTVALTKEIDADAQSIKTYISECENDFKITDKELKELESKIEDFKKKVEGK